MAIRLLLDEDIMSQLKETAVSYPLLRIGAQEFVLRYSYSSNYQLAKWKKTLQTATNIELGASMCGSFDSAGHWHSAGFANPIDLADLISNLDPEAQLATETEMLDAITDALKKAFPALEIVQTPSQPGTPAMETTKNNSSNSGHSQSVEAA